MRGCELCFSGGGLTGTYFSEQNYTGVSATRQEPSLDYPFGAWEGYSVKYTLPLPGGTETAVPAFSAKFTGRVRPPTTDIYTFHVSVDNDTWLWVNGTLILERHAGGWDGTGGVRYVQASSPVSLSSGQWVPIELRVVNQGGPAHVSVRWSTASNPAIVAIPPANLSLK